MDRRAYDRKTSAGPLPADVALSIFELSLKPLTHGLYAGETTSPRPGPAIQAQMVRGPRYQR